MIGTQFTLTNKAHPERTITFNDHTTSNFVALQAFPSFDIEIRNDEIPREGQHGVWDFFSFYGKRVITFEGVIIGDTEADVLAIKNTMESVLSLPQQPTSSDDGTIIISWTDALGRAVQTEAKIASSTKYNRGLRQTYKLDFLMTLKSSNPSIESQELFEVNGLRGYPMGGLTLPFSLPELLDTTLVNKFEVNNLGNTIAESIITLYGSPNRTNNNPRILNITTGIFMQINVELTDETKFVRIDSALGTIVDELDNDLSGSIEPGSGFITFGSGINEMFYSTDESVGEDGPVATRVEPDEIIETEHRFTII